MGNIKRVDSLANNVVLIKTSLTLSELEATDVLLQLSIWCYADRYVQYVWILNKNDFSEIYLIQLSNYVQQLTVRVDLMVLVDRLQY